MTNRDTLIELLANKFPGIWTKPGEEWKADRTDMIWSGEGSYIKEKYDGEEYEVEAFDYYAESEMYEFGVHIKLAEFLTEHGYYTECNDPGTYHIVPA